MVTRIQGQILLEALVLSALLFTSASACVLLVLVEQGQCQRAQTIENGLLVALNGNTVVSEVPCDDLASLTELRCLLNGSSQPINGVIHRIDQGGLVMEWPKLGQNGCMEGACGSEMELLNTPILQWQ